MNPITEDAGYDIYTSMLAQPIAKRLLRNIHFSDNQSECDHPANADWLEQRSEQLAPLVADIADPIIQLLRNERAEYRNSIIDLLGGNRQTDTVRMLIEALRSKVSADISKSL